MMISIDFITLFYYAIKVKAITAAHAGKYDKHTVDCDRLPV